jgi:hypothetical protein
MRVSGAYGTHLGPLIAVMNKTDGDVLELGIGFFSTPYLHYQCLLSDRKLFSYDNDRGWVRKFVGNFGGYKYRSPNHDFNYIKDWKDADIDKFWDVALIDHSPDSRRIEEVKRLADNARYIIIHDSNERHEDKYHYSEIYPLFKYKRVWDKDDRHATVLSNFVSLDNLWTP